MILELLTQYYISGASKTMSFADWLKKEGIDLESIRYLGNKE